MKRCGLYFGSFNPFHIGHLAIANYLVSFTDLDMVRMILSPRNPLKVPVQVHEIRVAGTAGTYSPGFGRQASGY
jgi:nicotinic acid mononucleotide adenylyltransferase